MMQGLISQTQTREQLKTRLAQAPPIDADDLAFIVANADLLSDEQGAALSQVSDATSFGTRQKFVRLGIGAAIGLALGVVVGKWVL